MSHTGRSKVLVLVELFEDVGCPEEVVVVRGEGANIRVGAIVRLRAAGVVTSPVIMVLTLDGISEMGAHVRGN